MRARLRTARVDLHLQTQDSILAMPGIALEFVGRIERFSEDIMRVLDHIAAGSDIRGDAAKPVNSSQHGPCAGYYTPELRDRV